MSAREGLHITAQPIQPLVSVVVPCLNRAHFLKPTLESIFQQSYPKIECLVIDGGSTDGTVDILKSYGDKLRWISEPDRGHADAINKGWRMSRGEILAWLNADDCWVVPDAVSKVVAYFRRHSEVQVVYGNCSRIDEYGNIVGMAYLREWNLAYAVERCDHCIPQPAAFCRRKILEEVGWLDQQLPSKHDHELWLRIGLVGSIRHIPVLLAHERACPGYVSKKGDVTAADCVWLTEKFLQRPDAPSHLRRRRRPILGNAYLRGARYAVRDGGHYGVALAFIMRSLWFRPGNIGSVFWYAYRGVIEIL